MDGSPFISQSGIRTAAFRDFDLWCPADEKLHFHFILSNLDRYIHVRVLLSFKNGLENEECDLTTIDITLFEQHRFNKKDTEIAAMLILETTCSFS